MSVAGDRPRELTRLQRAAIAVGPVLLLALYSTWRIREINGAGWRQLRSEGRSFIFALWHGHMLPLVVRHRSQGVRILISEHRDGEVIARIAGRLGLASIRGSSSRGAARALLAMCDALRDGGVVAVTPDGPRGPARSFASGTIVAAHRSGAPVVAIGVAASRAWRLRSWDAFMIPKPFARVAIAYSDPMFVDAPDARAAATQIAIYEGALNDAVAAAERALTAAGANEATRSPAAPA
ncbi:MAG: lysophospholipid acyltransferase family protein [Gemmatimonadota bacterium]|nr:lysophospholipid acyltransferase family protein [Gemmatimonadota bacterium]